MYIHIKVTTYMDHIRLYKTVSGNVIEFRSQYYLNNLPWNQLVNRDNLYDYLQNLINPENSTHIASPSEDEILPPIDEQEVWAAGVTYLRSKTARMEESAGSGADSFYDLVYKAERPELFFKSSPGNVVGSNDVVHIRKDSVWNVPEPELTLFINSNGHIQGYTIGNDMSSRSIEGENPLYLPQAKVYDRSAAIGPALLVTKEPINPDTVIHMMIKRNDHEVFNDHISIRQMKREHNELVHFLFRENTFPSGCYMMTGTSLVPPSSFTLQVNDEVEITINEIGILKNKVGQRK
ncbi:MAG TPA: fumarylacetoacetate hydrolase family protein [Flavitalea sp.]|nr:fumarylacetoacetate hydrolase family protein [Flavitalea sp.]